MQKQKKVYSLVVPLIVKLLEFIKKRTIIIEESIHVSFDETNPISSRKEILDDITDSLEDMHIHEKGHKGKGDGNNRDSQINENQTNVDLPKEWRTSRYHPLDNIICDISKGVTTQHSLKDASNNMTFVSLIEPKNINEVIIDEHWIISMQEELNQFERNKV